MAFGQLNAQMQTAHWYFGGNAGVDFSSGSPVVETNGQVSTIEGNTSISDEHGNLLFYTDGRIVYNSTHQVMVNGTGLRGDASSTTSAIILPKPDDCNLYYIFTIDLDADKVPAWRPQRGIEYNIVDMSLNNGSGEVIEKNIPVPINAVVQGYEKMAAISNADKTGYWIVTHFESNFYAFEITADGVNLNHVVSPSAIFGGVNRIGYLKGSSDGSKLAMGMSFSPIGQDKYLSLYNFNSATGEVTNETLLHYPGMLADGYSYNFYGIEFSPNSEMLYTTVRKVSGSNSDEIHEVWQFNTTNTNVLASKYIVQSGQQDNEAYSGAIQLGLDDKIYVNTYTNEANGHFLGRIENPNVAYNGITGEFPIFTPEVIDFGNIITGVGLPTFLNHYFRIAITVNDLSIQEDQLYCTGELLDFNFCHQGGEIESIHWDFGDGSTSDAFYPQYAYNTPGVHTITITLIVDGQTYIRTFDITITGPPDIEDASLSFCDTGAPQTFNLQDAMPQINPSNEDVDITFHQSEDEASNDENPLPNSVTATTTTMVYVRAEDNNGCYVVRELELVIHPLPSLDVLTPVEICYGTYASLSVNIEVGNMVNWYASYNGIVPVSTGNPFETPELIETASYWVETVNDYGCVSERLEVTVNVPTENMPLFTLNQIYCLNAMANPLPTVSDNGISGSWSPSIVNTSILGTQTHIFTTDVTECGDVMQISIVFEVKDISTPEFDLYTEYLFGEIPQPLPDVSINSISGIWYPTTISQTGTYVFTPFEDQCAESVSVEIKVIKYPKFFTPNGDSQNDYWNINGFSEVHQAKIQIFDRYGKLIKLLKAPGPGWDGTYNGNNMPTNDYWFKVLYQVPELNGSYVAKEFRSHFTLKR